MLCLSVSECLLNYLMCVCCCCCCWWMCAKGEIFFCVSYIFSKSNTDYYLWQIYCFAVLKCDIWFFFSPFPLCLLINLCCLCFLRAHATCINMKLSSCFVPFITSLTEYNQLNYLHWWYWMWRRCCARHIFL